MDLYRQWEDWLPYLLDRCIVAKTPLEKPVLQYRDAIWNYLHNHNEHGDYTRIYGEMLLWATHYGYLEDTRKLFALPAATSYYPDIRGYIWVRIWRQKVNSAEWQNVYDVMTSVWGHIYEEMFTDMLDLIVFHVAERDCIEYWNMLSDEEKASEAGPSLIKLVDMAPRHLALAKLILDALPASIPEDVVTYCLRGQTPSFAKLVLAHPKLGDEYKPKTQCLMLKHYRAAVASLEKTLSIMPGGEEYMQAKKRSAAFFSTADNDNSQPATKVAKLNAEK